METVGDYINAVRALLQDEIAGSYRYSDAKIRMAFQFAFDEAYRVRPDMFIRRDAPNMTTITEADAMPVPRGYKSTWVYYAAGYVQIQDNEDTQDARAAGLLGKFTAQLLTTAA